MPNEVVATLKGDGSAPWAVIHADTVEEVDRLIEEALAGPFFQNIAEASTLLAGATKVANGMPPAGAAPAAQNQGYNRQPVTQNQGYNSQASAGNSSFNGTPHPEGKTCPACGAGIVGKQPREKRMWTCPNQRSKGDGHYVEWLNG